MVPPRRTRIYRSLMEIKTIGGVERGLAIMNATIAVALTIGLHVWGYVIAAIGLHMILAYLTKRDPYMRLVYIRYNTQAHVYDPWPHAVQRRGQRPHGFGRGSLC